MGHRAECGERRARWGRINHLLSDVLFCLYIKSFVMETELLASDSAPGKLFFFPPMFLLVSLSSYDIVSLIIF